MVVILNFKTSTMIELTNKKEQLLFSHKIVLEWQKINVISNISPAGKQHCTIMQQHDYNGMLIGLHFSIKLLYMYVNTYCFFSRTDDSFLQKQQMKAIDVNDPVSVLKFLRGALVDISHLNTDVRSISIGLWCFFSCTNCTCSGMFFLSFYKISTTHLVQIIW